MNKLDFKHRDMTEEECYNNVCDMYKQDPTSVMNPKRWLKLHKEYLKEKADKYKKGLI